MLVVCSSLVVQSSGATTTIRRELIGNATEISLVMAAMAGADSGESSIAQQPASSALSVDTLDTTVPTSESEVSDATSPTTASSGSGASAPLESETDLADPTSTTTPDLIVKSATAITTTSTTSDLDALGSASSSSPSGSGASSTTPSKLTSTKKTTSTTKKTSIVSSIGSGSSGSSSGSSTKKKSSAKASSESSGNGKYAGSGSSLTYACSCKDVRKVSLTGQSDYCLAPDAIVENKCGNAVVGENGECPRTGAQPCSVTGHTLANDSLCLFDDSDSVYKCAASAEDLEIKKNGGKKKKSNSTASQAPNAISSDAGSRPRAVSSFQVVTLTASIALGIVMLA
ncbi:hypothetical protein FI667_g9963, partial [Globisporangium splendens]